MAKQVVSKHAFVYQRLRDRIASGECPPGAPLPSESALTRDYGVSRTVVRKALQRLTAEGLIARRRGSGSVVTAGAPTILARAPALRAAFIVPYGNAANPVHLGVLRCLHELAGGDLALRLLCASRLDFDRLAALGVDAAIVDGSFAAAAPRPPSAWAGRAILFNRASTRYDYVTTDNFVGGQLMARHLLERGHRRVGVIHYGLRDENDFAERLRGLRDGLAAAGLSPAKEVAIALHDYRAFPPRAAARAMLGAVRAGGVTAVALITDLLALPFYEEAEAAAMRPGRDFALIGFDDQPFARFLSPSLTTMRQPTETLAARIVDALRRSAADPNLRAFCKERVAPALLARESTGG